MILLIIKSYLTILISIGLGGLLIFIIGLYLIFRKPSKKVNAEELRDLNAIAGDDVITTQLDLARAFIETGRTQSAKTILKVVAKQGSASQQKEAKKLMNHAHRSRH